MKARFSFTLILILLSFSLFAQSAHSQSLENNPVANSFTQPVSSAVYNVQATQRLDGSRFVDISYQLFAPEQDHCTISLYLSFDGGESFDYQPASENLSGDIGYHIPSGSHGQIVWDAGAELIDIENDTCMILVKAEYITNPRMIYVAGGTFHNGTSSVTISSFYIDKYELTQADYEAMMGTNPSYFGGNPGHPVERVSWYEAIEYCNRRSIAEAFTPCYSYNGYGTNPDHWPSGWNSIDGNHTNVSCDWAANGYRLPTEMEWMFAAKGGNQSQGYTYSGSNDVDSVAWYSPNSSNSTHPVGTKAPNELGIYDMSGNVWEWVWDIAGDYSSVAQTNPHGPNSGARRGLRGGAINSNASFCTVSYRNNGMPMFSVNFLGFRICRIAP